ncbi:unnamed protein product [Phyllotreta striolata]|uniref:Dynein-1, subspecies f n=1 Tax=Phyllotreta striolata TaxID=444603 RepID=A0A9N9TUI6_PHYSR|nr:unnamed protein product [Phyllotreta striolata]
MSTAPGSLYGEKDSLFSSEGAENLTQADAVEEKSEERLVVYTDAELKKLVSYVKDITMLFGLQDCDWNETNQAVIKNWFQDVSNPVLSIYFQGVELKCCIGIPDGPLEIDLMYFMRQDTEPFSVDTFHDKVLYGNVTDNIDGTMLHIVRDIYGPTLFANSKWPDNVRNEFSQKLQMFLAKMTDLHFKLYGLTVLYVPQEVLLTPLNEACNDKELIKRLEGIVVYWTKQIRVGLQDQDQFTPEDLLCPIDEFEFWKCRYENLLGLDFQQKNEGILHICDILHSVQSTYVRQFKTFAGEIMKNIEESKSNIEYLNILVEPCQELYEVKDLKRIAGKIPKIMHLIRYIWLHSPFYNTKEKITQLYRAVSNQVILQCQKYIDLDIVFKAKETRKAIAMFKNCTDALAEYIKIYISISRSHEICSEMPWNLDRGPIFNHVDSFVKRCNDMIEVCEVMICFGRFDETEKIPKPMFSGSKGEEFDQWAERIEIMFQEALLDIESVKHRILVVKSSEWYDDILKFRTRMKDIEVVIENLTNAVFEQVSNVEEGIEALAALHNYTKRRTLLTLFEGKTTAVYKMFRDEIMDTMQEFQTEAEVYLKLVPYYAGRSHLLKMKKRRLQLLMKLFSDATWMMPCGITKDIMTQCEKLVKSINDACLNLYRKWLDTVQEDVLSKLNRPLMCKNKNNSGLLECNFDKSLLDLFHEIYYWSFTRYAIPTYLRNIFAKRDSIKLMYECMFDVTLSYNKIITSLSEEERTLFKPLINGIEKKISPGLTRLTWATDVGDDYTNDCFNTTAELQTFLDDYKSCNMTILAISEQICDHVMITLKANYAYDINELVEELSDSMQKAVKKFSEYYTEITELLILVFEGFEPNIGNMASEWMYYVNNIDKLLEEALKVACRNTLSLMFEALHGDGTTEPNPVIKLIANLINNRIRFKPSLAEVAALVSNIHKGLVNSLKALPRINQKFALEGEIFTGATYSELISEDDKCLQLQVMLNQEVRVNVDKLREYMKNWEPFRDLWEVDKEKFIARYEKEEPSASVFDSNIARYTEMANKVNMLETLSAVHFAQINCADLKQSIIANCMEWQDKMCNLLHKMTVKKIKNFYNYTKVNAEEAMKEPTNLDEMQMSIELFELLKDEIPMREEMFPAIREQILTLDKYNVPVSDNLRNMEKNIPTEWAAYLEMLETAERMIEFSKERFKSGLLEKADLSRKEAAETFDNVMRIGPFTAEVSCLEAWTFLRDVRKKLTDLRTQDEELRNDLAIFGLSFGDNLDLSRLDAELTALEIVWNMVTEWDDSWNSWKTGQFWTIETTEMEETAQVLFRRLTKLARELKEKGWTVIDETRNLVDAFRRTLPLIADLKNPAMRPRHWSRVKEIVEVDFDETSDDFNLEVVYALQLHKFSEEVNEISYAATMELQIENGLQAVAGVWSTMKFEMAPYKERKLYRIKSTEECFQALEENIMQLSVMRSTKFVEPFSKEVDQWERALSYIMETLEAALNVQRDWMYLESIMYGEDIRRQLPLETAQFDEITNSWRGISTRLYVATSALAATHFKAPPYLLNKLNKMLDQLDKMQKALEKYLETKRHIFPRFYFVSNDDVLEVLGNSKKPEMVQQHLKKLFDNINKVKIEKNLAYKKMEALGMYADDGEYMEFVRPVLLDGPSEQWLCKIESAMRLILKTAFKPCRAELKKMLNKRDKWLMTNCGQLCNACSLIQWTSDCTRGLVHSKILESKKPLKKLRRKQNGVLAKLSELSRKDLSKLLRLKANALITIEIHSRDVIDRLYRANCRDTNAFEWFSQLRFYWDRDLEDCVIRQTNTHFMYGYEYNGNSGRLVITPLTDRCYITLTTALHLFRGGSPKGPAGTGKTETVKDLGKAMSIWVIVTNCSEGLDFKSMGKCFSGLAQTGAWGCFDEFNRINIEVLSVVAQQILCVLSAVSQRLKFFVFDGIEIKLKLTVGAFITMNPGYAGRTELPDNLKSMFRPISMMVPDSGIIAENVLFSDGFTNTKILAKKVFTLYKLAMQQLSKQDHYDFGLRSMVALLRYAGKKRRQMPNLPEEQMAFLAMRDMNVARLTYDDLPLFNGIMSDIFPGVNIPVVDYIDMNVAITECMEEHNYQPFAKAMVKVIQLYETKNSRHSTMILGKTCTAKSVTWKILKCTMKKLQAQNKPGFQKVKVFPLNPKALNLAELYGEYDLTTNDWLDGVISAIMRTTCSDESPIEKWILFDGPVDAVWIENMNSVMDDNKVLTLINSDRITMPEQVSLLFEVADLAVASPATVSRCGMVYNDYKDMGWMPYVTCWINSKQEFGEKYMAKMHELFQLYMKTILEFKHMNCEEKAETAELNLVISCCKFLDIFMNKKFGVNPANEEKFDDAAKSWFLFCIMWSVCCTTDEEGRKKIDNFIREKESIFPVKDSIYEYYVDHQTFNFVSWSEKLPYGWKFETGCPFHQIIVPTIDTVRYDFLVKSLLKNNNPVLLTGPVGTGKTSVVQSALRGLNPDKYTVLNVNMSAQTSSNNLQEAIESRLEKRTKGHFAPPMGKKLVAFLDDMNMPAKETYGSQPPLELLRQWMDYTYWYDRLKQTRKYIENTLVMGAMGPPGGGRNIITERLQSCFNLINITFPDEETLARIFGSMLSQHVSDFDEVAKLVSRELTEATIDLYNAVCGKMLPTPAKLHYLFNLRDISKVFQGLLRSHKDYQNDKASMLRLWLHECYRVFSDRLIDEQDRDWFNKTINSQLTIHFDAPLSNLLANKEILMFADFVNPWGVYEEHSVIETLKTFLETQLEEYNNTPGNVAMDLVLFKDAIGHVCRIARVISQSRGNMLLIGMGGSGRRSLCRLASYVCEYGNFQITVNKNYRIVEFKEDMKVLYGLTGVALKPQSFIFADNQILDEGFLEIINNMLSSGEIANLYKPDEFEDVKSKLEPAIKKFNIQTTNESIYKFLIGRVRASLHIVLCMSPVGEAFRNRLRQYPALINCTTIDWFKEWPRQALLEVANKYIANVNFVETITGIPRHESQFALTSTQDYIREQMAYLCSIIHDSVVIYSEKMLNELKRHNYVTPTNYLELVYGYKTMLSNKREETSYEANRLRNGLYKIDDCQEKVKLMSVELEEAQVQVEAFQQQCDEYMLIIMAQRKEADEQQKEVAKTSAKIEEEAVEINKMAELAQADLQAAMPALLAAMGALDSLSKKDITEIKSYVTPPQKVKMVMEAVNILLGVDPSWDMAKKLLGGMSFLQDLKDFDKDNIDDKTLKKITVYTSNDEFVPDKVGQVSAAAKSLCLWVIAIEKYARVWKVVGPKKAKLEETLNSLKEKENMLAMAQQQLTDLNNYLLTLQQEYEDKQLQKEELNRKARMLEFKLERAATLVECLSGERERWIETVKVLDSNFDFLPGDCLLATAFISYLGPFLSNYREELQDMWQEECNNAKIVISKDFNVITFLADPNTIREWNQQGLPADNFSAENGIIVDIGSRWPLVIDPQCQAMKWIKAKEAKNGLHVIDFGTTNYMLIVEKAIQIGTPILLQNIGETIDPSLEPVVGKAIVKSGGDLLIKIEDKLLSYNEQFKFFITTKLTNPHYPPEICTKATLINFAVKESGLESQMLSIVVRKEKPQLEEQKDELVATISKGKKTLKELENELLRLLNEIEGSLLDSEELYDTLQDSKATSETVKVSLEIAVKTEVQIDLAREGYRPSATRAAILFFVLNDMGQIDPMYQFALDAYIILFVQSILKSPKSLDLLERISMLNDYHTYAVYKNTCRALFEQHKLLFSFHMCMKILKGQGKINLIEYNFLLKGGIVLDRSRQRENPCPNWMSEIAWDNITELEKMGGFKGVADSFEQFQRDWYSWYIHTEPETLPLIGDWDAICNEFQKMLFIRSLRQDRIQFAISTFIVNQLGPQFVEPPVLDIKAVLEESLPETPLIFVLSPGVDPTAGLLYLAEQTGMIKSFQSISLGQGQAPIATKLIQIGSKDGHWIFLANCHLSLSWMPKLDKIIELLQTETVHPSFRIWLSSSPNPEFPISILQAGIKMTTEPPKGVKANLKRLYQLITEEQFTACQFPEKYKKLLFALCFFHSILLERKKFQQLGWNVVYSFNDSDFQVSENLLTIYLNEYTVTPWDALKYLIAGVNYGGHVTDDWDRRLLLTYINQYYCEEAITGHYFRLSALPTYYIPRDGSIQSYLDYIALLPNTDRPEAFGQHPNADIASLISESRNLFETLMSLEVQSEASGGMSKEQKVAELAKDIYDRVPRPLDYFQLEKSMGVNKTPLDVVLLQEIQRYNVLLTDMQEGIEELQKAILGIAIMTNELEEIFDSIFDARVPPTWLKAYSSLKSLGNWTRDLIARIHYFSDWATTRTLPLFFWLASYTFPTGFLTAVLQTTARSQEVPIDTLGWEFTVIQAEENTIQDQPDNGVYIREIYLEGASWDKKKRFPY